MTLELPATLSLSFGVSTRAAGLETLDVVMPDLI
jgi:hypothetical protein